MISFISGNGTARSDLVRTRIEAVHTLREAMVAFRQTAPHGRDYVGAEGQYEIDRKLFVERQQRLMALIAAVEEEAYALTQIPGRP